MKCRCMLLTAAMAAATGCGAEVGDVATEAQEVSAAHRPSIAPPGSRPLGRTYGEWEAAWWQWSMRIPAARDPIGDATGEHCAEGQSGPVWFLAGTWGGTVRRQCTVPRNKALYFPVANQIWSQFLTDPPTTLREMRAYVRDAARGATLSATIDGRAVEGLERYYEETPVFPATFGLDNSWGVTASECARRGHLYVCPLTVDAGYGLFLEPLSPGDHTIHFAATFRNGFALDVTYSLRVR